MAKVIKLHKKIKVPVRYKYRIHDYVKKVGWSVQSVVEDLKEMGISKHMFYRDSNIPSKSVRSIPSDRLLIYAKYFEVSVEELYNELVNKIPTPLE
jgi:hypothetical protein